MYEHSEAVNKVQLDLNSQRGRYDFIIQPHRELGKFATNGHLVEIGEFMDDPALRDPTFKPEKQLYQTAWHEISWYDGKVYGFPFTALNMFMWYRSDLFSDPKEQEGFKAKYGYDAGAGTELGPVPRHRRVVLPDRTKASTARPCRASATKRCGTSG